MIAPVYAACLAILMIVLSLRVSLTRRRSGISLGWGDDTDLAERVRSFGNFAEWAPMALMLIVLAELAGAPGAALHSAGGLLVLGRVLHPIQLRMDVIITPLRFLGMVATYAAILIATYHLARIGTGF